MDAAHARKPLRLPALDLRQVDRRRIADGHGEHRPLPPEIDRDLAPERRREIEHRRIEFRRRDLVARHAQVVQPLKLADDDAPHIRKIAQDFLLHQRILLLSFFFHSSIT